MDYIIWSAVLHAKHGNRHRNAPSQTYVFKRVVDHVKAPNDAVLFEKVATATADELRASFDARNPSDEAIDVMQLTVPKGAVVYSKTARERAVKDMSFEDARAFLSVHPELQVESANEMGVSVTNPGYCAGGRYALLLVDWYSGPRASGADWWLLEKHAKGWQLRAQKNLFLS